jgi:hypothetical protein
LLLQTNLRQSQEKHHLFQLEKCQKHLRAHDNVENVNNYYAEPVPKSKLCPHKDCERIKPFTSRQRLQRHFQTRQFLLLFLNVTYCNFVADVLCYEVCVFCFKMPSSASEFLRHFENNHKTEAAGIKLTYMEAMVEEIKERVDEKLILAENSKQLAGEGWSRKRELQELDRNNVYDQTNGIYILLVSLALLIREKAQLLHFTPFRHRLRQCWKPLRQRLSMAFTKQESTTASMPLSCI